MPLQVGPGSIETMETPHSTGLPGTGQIIFYTVFTVVQAPEKIFLNRRGALIMAKKNYFRSMGVALRKLQLYAD